MGVAAKLQEWQAAALIDKATAAAILAHEDQHRRPVALLAVAGLGVLALVLGVVSVVAANWDDFPAWSKIFLHLALTAIAAVVAWRFAWRGPVWVGEVALFLLAGLVLAGIALHAQVYQQTGALWQPLAWWAVLVTPAVLMLSRTRLMAAGYGSMLIALAATTVFAELGWAADALAAALPAALVTVALALPQGERQASFIGGLFRLGLGLALLAASVAQLTWLTELDSADIGWTWQRMPIAALLVASGCVLAFRRLAEGEAVLVAAILGGALVAVLMACGLPHGDGVGARFVGLIVYTIFWGAVAAGAMRAGWSRLFGLAVVALAGRLFLVYVELFYSLAFTGIGLIVGGLLLIGLTWGSTRIVRRAKA